MVFTPDVASKFVCVVGSAVGDVVLCPDGVQEANARDRYKLWTVWRRQALAPSSVQTNSLRGACRIPTTLHGPDAMYCYCMSLASLRQVCVVCVLMVAVLQTPSQDSRPNSLGNINPAPKHAATATHRHQQHATTRERGPTTYGRVTSSRIKVAFDPVTLLQSPSPAIPSPSKLPNGEKNRWVQRAGGRGTVGGADAWVGGGGPASDCRCVW